MHTGTSLPDEPTMYEALLRRDASYEGVFWAAVRTTGIVCRPTCPARKPQVRNVEFFARLADALAAGYRPCARCRPQRPSGDPPEWLGRLETRLAGHPTGRIRDAELRELGFDPGRVRRWFQRAHGITFQAYQRSLRLGGALARLRRGQAVTAAAFDSGYESPAAFHEAFERLFGTPPGSARERAAALTATRLTTPLGPMVAVAAADGLCLLEFADRPMLAAQLRRLRRVFRAPIVAGRSPHLEQVERELAGYFAGSLREFTTPLVLPGTPFQTAHWARLRAIPYGETTSYESHARALGRPGAQRAVGRANGDNPIAIVVPCHRVLRADGSLCGYGGGLWRKRRLLEHEQATRKGVSAAS
jgi:AraC family transcriptional regulator of adaptative response/methylated-DNA-[protein]-cysteine methyltransferase